MCGCEVQQRAGGNVVSASVDLRRLTTPQDLFQAAAEEVLRIATDAVAKRGRFTMALSGGSTPKNLYTLIAANASAALPWAQMFFFWGDERHVPPDDPDSNYRMAKEALLSKVPIPPGNIFPIPAENQGMGPDGHTASLFPETAALQEKSRLVVANWVEKLKTSRITLTLPVLNAARCVAFLVSGADKAAVLHEVLEGSAPAEKYPSKLVQPTNGKLIWFLDRAAASQLSTAA